jgi:hypothetical protein
MRLEDGYYRLKGFSTDTAKSLELRWVKLLYFFVGHQIEVAFDPVLSLFLDSCKRSKRIFGNSSRALDMEERFSEI